MDSKYNWKNIIDSFDYFDGVPGNDPKFLKTLVTDYENLPEEDFVRKYKNASSKVELISNYFYDNKPEITRLMCYAIADDIYKIRELLNPSITLDILDETLKPKEKNQLDEINKLLDDIYKLRQESIAESGEYSTGNLIFKEFRNRGYLDKLKEKAAQLETIDMSLTEDEREAQAKLNDKVKAEAARYRQLLGVDSDYKITAENLDRWALGKVSSEFGIDSNSLTENLFNN